MSPRLKVTYDKEIVSKLMSKLSLKNKHDVPKITKIVLNMGLGEDASDGKKLKTCIDDMALIAGQKPVTTKFKKHINILRGTVEGQVALDHQYPKVFRKVAKYYEQERGVQFMNDPCDDYEILLDCLYNDLVAEGVIDETDSNS